MNKRVIMTRAWELYRTGSYSTFAACLRQSWAEAKRTAEMRANGYVCAAELNVGDTFAVTNCGGCGENFNTTITDIKATEICDKQYVVLYFGENNNDVCLPVREMVKRIATATMTIAKAA